MTSLPGGLSPGQWGRDELMVGADMTSLPGGLSPDHVGATS